MSDNDKQAMATQPADLEKQIMDPRIAKNEREWWAAREIEKLRTALVEARNVVRKMPGESPLTELMRLDQVITQALGDAPEGKYVGGGDAPNVD